MKNLLNKPSDKQFKIEPEWKLKLKELVRDFRRKKLFYTEHSKFATYIDSDYLRIFETEVIAYSKKHIRQQTDMNMSAENPRGKETHASTRGLHVQDVGKHSEEVATRLLLNEQLARVGGELHDIGHTAFAHYGEQKLSEYLKNHGIAILNHPTLATYIIENEEIHEKTLERLKKEKGRPLTKRELKRYNHYKLIIEDIAAAHNGEGLDDEIVAKLDKTDEEIEQEYINSFVIPGASRKIVAKTPEAAIVRFIDPISYVAKDFRDGVIADVVNVHDRDYEELFRKIGIGNDVLTTKSDKKDKIVRAVTYALRDNLEAHSRGISGAKMDPEMAKAMYDLRDLNYEKAVGPRAKKITGVLTDRIPKLLDRYTAYLLQYKDYRDAPKDTYLRRYLKTVKEKEPEVVRKHLKEIVRRGIEGSLRREIDAVLTDDDKGEKTVRRKRIKSDLDALKRRCDITDQVKEAYVQRVLKEMYLSPEQSHEQLIKYFMAGSPEISKEEATEMAAKNPEMRFETFEECLARLRASLYVGMSSNTYVLEILKEENLLTKEEEALRYEYGGKDPSIIHTKQIQDLERQERAGQEAR